MYATCEGMFSVVDMVGRDLDLIEYPFWWLYSAHVNT
jgi:hypothetical protein